MMKNNKKIRAFFFMLVYGIFLSTLGLPVFAEMKFVHPGAINNKADLDFVKQKIAANEQPWKGQFNKLKELATTYKKKIAPEDGDENGQKYDARLAYANALSWYYTGNDVYAKNAIDVLNIWAETFKGYAIPPFGQGNQSTLNAAWIGALLGPAAEIMRGYAGWKHEDRTKLIKMFKAKFYPVLNQVTPWNGNVDLTQIDAMMNIAVFNEDETEFDLGIQRLNARNPAYFFLQADGDTPPLLGNGDNYKATWFAPLKWIDGLTQETCRDNNHHSQFAMASALHAAEVAWNQGVDVYSKNTLRYTNALELMANQILSGNMLGVCSNNIPTSQVFNTWEIGYNHYHNRKGVNLPFTKELILKKARIQSVSDWNIFFETLTHAK